MRTRNLRRGLRIQKLEDRRLLAADFVAELLPSDFVPPEQCEVSSIEDFNEVAVESEFDQTEITIENEGDSLGDPESSNEVEGDNDLESQTGVGLGEDDESANEETSAIHDLGDPVDGTDGFFGSIDVDNPFQTFSITPSEDGVIDIVVASSFGDAETKLEITDSDGAMVAASSTENLDGFQKLSFEANAGQPYQLEVASEDGGEGFFQVTISHSDLPEPQLPTDLHANEVGSESTLLEFVEGVSELSGDLESIEDVDTFRFIADGNGKASLQLSETDAGNSTELSVEVFNSAGEAVARGITNENVGISFNIESGSEYFIAINAAEGQVGSWNLAMTLETESIVDVPEQPVDDHVDEIGNDATQLTFEDGVSTISGQLETAEDIDVFQFTPEGDGVVNLDMVAFSESNSAEAAVTVFDSQSQQVVAGTTNDDVGIIFDVVEGENYQILVDSMNEIPASYELAVSLSLNEVAPVDPIDVENDTDEPSDTLDEAVNVDFVDEELGICLADSNDEGAEGNAVDEVFATLEGSNDFRDSALSLDLDIGSRIPGGEDAFRIG